MSWLRRWKTTRLLARALTVFSLLGGPRRYRLGTAGGTCRHRRAAGPSCCRALQPQCLRPLGLATPPRLPARYRRCPRLRPRERRVWTRHTRHSHRNNWQQRRRHWKPNWHWSEPKQRQARLHRQWSLLARLQGCGMSVNLARGSLVVPWMLHTRPDHRNC